MTLIISVSFLFSSFLSYCHCFNITSLLAPNSPNGHSMDRPQFVKGPNTMPALGVSENTPWDKSCADNLVGGVTLGDKREGNGEGRKVNEWVSYTWGPLDTSLKLVHRCLISSWKDAHREMQMKPPADSTIYLLKQWGCKTETTPNVCEAVEELEPSHIVDKNMK